MKTQEKAVSSEIMLTFRTAPNPCDTKARNQPRRQKRKGRSSLEKI